MKRTRLRFIWFIAILAALAAILLYTRMNSTTYLKDRVYHQWKNTYVVEKNNQAYVKTTNSQTENVVLSEGQGYGMVIAVDAAKQGDADQADFEQLYQYYLAQRLGDTQLMSWKQTVKGDEISHADENNATDGDLYIAYALIQAAKQWPDKADEYKAQAQAVLEDILRYNYNESNGVLTVGNWANAESEFYNLMRTSDTLPHQFEAFYELTNNQQWLTIKDNMLGKLEKISAQTDTGLLPDFMWVEGDQVRVADANTVESENDGFYSYNACRLPYNLAQSKDKKSQALLDKMMQFFMEQDSIYAGYNLKGQRLNSHQSGSFSAPVFYAANQDRDFRKLVQQNKYLFIQDLPSGNYYDAAMTTMVALGTL
ncbi:putative endoglucanase precursor [Streptococcus sp. DD11]|uniref:glycosyl hydrolase family 8 n=1 Tax=Streptococcus sp. DD11 TaxID=1777879 RepID=UPI000793DB24|nr:glycosyl hydrolase family 8 [Streptococcus sp. DD11]KXT83250.1 putative endoglucanase precursor [Streptococcus sp. DD11]